MNSVEPVAVAGRSLELGDIDQAAACPNHHCTTAIVRGAVEAERLRLLQEVHDVVSHGLAAIQMQADVALHVEQQPSGHAREALEAISHASATALAELRETLCNLYPAGRSGPARGRSASTPGIAQVPQLCRTLSEAGLNTELSVTGHTAALPGVADVAAYRVLQEALTNVVKHSAHPSAIIRIDHTHEAVVLEVTNQDLAAHDVTPGIGITGMHRRAASVGGTLYAGPGPTPHTFTVRAVIPRAAHRQPHEWDESSP